MMEMRAIRILDSRLRTDWTMELRAGMAPSRVRRVLTVKRTSFRRVPTSPRIVWNSPLVTKMPALLVIWLRMPASSSRRF